MAYTVSQVIADVRALLDEQGVDDSGFVNDGAAGAVTPEVDDAELDALIRARIVDARNFVLGGCDVSLLDDDCEALTNTQLPGVGFAIGTTQNGLRVTLTGGTATSVVGDVLRLVRVRAEAWLRSVTEFTSMDSADYPMLWDEVCTGTPSRPAAAEGFGSDGERVVELFGIKSEGEQTVSLKYCLWYVRSYELDDLTSDVKVNSEVLRGALRYYLAGLVAMVLGDARKDDFVHLATMAMGVATEVRGEG